MKTIITVAIPIILTVGILAGAWQFKLLPLAASTAAASGPVATTQPASVNYTMPERIVNLADSPGYRYLKIQVTLQFADPKHRPSELQGDALKAQEAQYTTTIDPYSPAMEDFLITTLTRKTAAELLTPTGKEELRAQLLEGLRQRVPEPTLQAVYFTEFVIQ